MRLFLIFVVCILVGCGQQREAAKAAEQGRQASEAVAKDLVAAFKDAALTLEGWKARAGTWLKLTVQAEASTAVAVKALSPDGPPQVTTSPDMAIQEPDRFCAEAQRQIGRAEQEIENNQRMALLAKWLGTYAASLVGGDLVTGLLTGVGGLSGAGALVLGAWKAVAAFRRRGEEIATTEKALVEAVRTGDELAAAEDDTAVKQVKKAAAMRQAQAGTKAKIEKALKTIKGGSHAV